jgi:hypothetical protein
MEELHPWLRLCDDHWKVDRVWTNYFSNWTPATKDKGKQPESLKRPAKMEAGPSQKKVKMFTEETAQTMPTTTKLFAKVSSLFFATSMSLLKHIQTSPL